MNETDFIKTIMNSFNCDKKMAETIYRTSEKSGELNGLKFLTGHERNEKE